jgi:hypothetical protein
MVSDANATAFSVGTGNDIGGAQNRLGVLFFLLLFLSLMSLSSLPIWHEERLLFRRERDASTYGTSAYFVAVYAFDILPLRVLPPTFFGLLAYQAIGLHPGCAACIWWFVVLLVLANVASATCSMAIGAATSTNSTANLVRTPQTSAVTPLFAGESALHRESHKDEIHTIMAPQRSHATERNYCRVLLSLLPNYYIFTCFSITQPSISLHWALRILPSAFR